VVSPFLISSHVQPSLRVRGPAIERFLPYKDGTGSSGHRRCPMKGECVMVIEHLWGRLEPSTQKWFIDNPGCLILPRSVAATISHATGIELEQDRHGEYVLSPGDCDFIHTVARRHAEAYAQTGMHVPDGDQPHGQ
jgi:hypothetical protein